MNKASICTEIKAQIPSDKIRNCSSSEAGSKRTAKASSIAKHNTTKSKHNKKVALTLRGKSAKDFSIKLGDTIL
jgi:phosphotransferase system HPr-like phosphotransfer protein